MVDRLDLPVDIFNLFAIALDIVSGDPSNPNLEQPQHIFVDHRPNKSLLVLLHTVPDGLANGV